MSVVEVAPLIFVHVEPFVDTCHCTVPEEPVSETSIGELPLHTFWFAADNVPGTDVALTVTACVTPPVTTDVQGVVPLRRTQ